MTTITANTGTQPIVGRNYVIRERGPLYGITETNKPFSMLWHNIGKCVEIKDDKVFLEVNTKDGPIVIWFRLYVFIREFV